MTHTCTYASIKSSKIIVERIGSFDTSVKNCCTMVAGSIEKHTKITKFSVPDSAMVSSIFRFEKNYKFDLKELTCQHLFQTNQIIFEKKNGGDKT